MAEYVTKKDLLEFSELNKLANRAFDGYRRRKLMFLKAEVDLIKDILKEKLGVEVALQK